MVTANENAAIYSTCIDIAIETQRGLEGKLSLDSKEIDVRRIAINLYENCAKRDILIYPNEDGSFTSKLKCSCSYELAVDQFGFESFKKELDNYLDDCKTLKENVKISLTNTIPFKEEKLEKGKVFTLPSTISFMTMTVPCYQMKH